MKKILFAALPLLALSMLALKPLSGPGDPLAIGSSIPNPDIKMKDVSGSQYSLGDVKTSKGLLVMFSCNTCPYVIKNQGRTYGVCKLAEGMGIGVAVLNSNEAQRGDADSFDEMKTYAKSQGYFWKYLVDTDSKLADAFGASRTPECFLFDGNGKLVYHGAIDDNPSDASAVSRQHLQTAIADLLAGREISVKESRSVGCSIKRK